MQVETRTTEPITPRRKPLAGGAALAFAMLAATPLSAQLIDLDLTTGAPACVATDQHTQTYDTVADVDETISALTDGAGDPVFWTLIFNAAASTVGCTETAPPPGFTSSLACDNGVDVALPAGADATTSVSSTLPVTVAVDPLGAGETVGEVVFDLTAGLDGGAFTNCTQQYKVTRNEPKEVFDLIFVLDRSGSMGATSGGGTRWTALRTGVETFKPFIQTSAQEPTPEGSQFSVTFFHSNVDPASTALGDILDGGGPSTDFGNLISLLDAQAPGDATAMGQGLQDALGKLTAADRTQVIVLFTDGEQNVDPQVALDGCNFTSPASAICSAGVKICTIGIGSPSGDYLTTLQNLAVNNDCSMLITDNGSSFTGDDAVAGDIGATFANTIGAALDGNSPQQVARYAGPMLEDPNAPAPIVLPTFDVNDGVDNVMLSFVFSQRFETPQLLQLLAGMNVTRDGTPVLAEFEPMISSNFSDVLTLISVARPPEGPARDLSGTYEVTMTLPTAFRPDLEFRLGVYVEDLKVDAESTLTPVQPVVGGTVDVAVQLNYLNLGLEGASVVVRAFAPGADMGELLSQGDPVELSSAPDAANPGIQKFDQLAANDPNFLTQLALSPNAIAMTDAGGGLYTGSFPVPDNVGVIHLVYDVAASGPIFGDVQRHWYESVYAGFNQIDIAGSNLSWTRGESGLILSFTPVRPPSLKKVGPGNGGAFTFEGANVLEVQDLQNGSYQYTLDTDDPETPITVEVLGNEVYSGPAGWGEGPPKSIVDILLSWWLILLILLLLLLLLIWWWRRPAGP